MRYRVDTVPLALKPLFFFYSYGLGTILYLTIQLVAVTVRIKEEGKENLVAGQNYIFTMWHCENIPAFVSGFFNRTGRRFIMINHPAWYMKPVHLVLIWLGVQKMVLGSTGHNGRAAADTLVHFLKSGVSTHINPDGPAGPAKMLKKGVLHIAEQSGLPIIPVKFLCAKEWVLNKTWDHKRIPLPFTTITIQYNKPILAETAETNELQKVAALINQGLNS